MYKKDLTLVLEGPDGSGKSTLVKALKDLYPTLDLVDRAFISDAVYAKKFNRKIYLNVPIDIYLQYWSNWYKNKGDSRIILCTAEAPSLANRCLSKNDPLCSNKLINDIYKELYEDNMLFNLYVNKYSSMFRILILQTDKLSLTTCIKRIEDFIEDAKI